MARASRTLVGVAAVWAALALAACSADAASSPSAASSGGASAPGAETQLSGTLTVFAAASLTESFTELGERLMAAHPELSVVFSFAGSSTLAAQIVAGAPADVFAAASVATMQTVVDDAGGSPVPEVFARNSLQIAVPVGNPAGVTGLADLARPELSIALCAPEVPCGAAAEAAFAAAGLTPAPDTLERDVRAVLTKVVLGEVDAALVYRTDVIAAEGRVEPIAFDEASAAVNEYPIVALAGSGDPGAARAFVELVLSQEGRDVLADAGFERP